MCIRERQIGVGGQYLPAGAGGSMAVPAVIAEGVAEAVMVDGGQQALSVVVGVGVGDGPGAARAAQREQVVVVRIIGIGEGSGRCV